MINMIRALPEVNLAHILRGWGVNPQPIIKWGIIGGILLLSLLVGFRPTVLLLALPVGAAGALLFLRRPGAALVCTVIGGMVVPFSGPGGLNLTMLGIAGLIGIWLFGMVYEHHSIWFASPVTTRAALFMLVVVLLAFVVGQISWYRTQGAPLTAQIGGTMVFVLSFGVAIFVGNQLKNSQWLRWLVWLFIGYGTLHLLGWISPTLGRYTGRLFADGSTGSMFWTWLPTLAFSQAVFNKRLSPGIRVALMVVVAMTFYVAYLLNGDWKSGWMPGAISVAVILLLRSWRFGYLLAFMGIFPAIEIFSSALASDEYSYSTRMDAWYIVGEIVKANPILGLGPANYYWYTPLFRIRGYAVAFNSHNQYIDLIAQAGILGLLAFGWFMWQIGRIGWLLRAKVEDGFEKAFVYGTLGGWVATLVAATFGDWVLPFVYNVGLGGMRSSILPWIFFGALIMLDLKYQNVEKATVSQ